MSDAQEVERLKAKLKACPFCGRKGILEVDVRIYGTVDDPKIHEAWTTNCPEGHAYSLEQDTAKQAAAWWNMRRRPRTNFRRRAMNGEMDTSAKTLADTIKALRQREVQAIGAGLSRRDWHATEAAYNDLRDKLDRALATVRADGKVLTIENCAMGDLYSGVGLIGGSTQTADGDAHETNLSAQRKTIEAAARIADMHDHRGDIGRAIRGLRPNAALAAPLAALPDRGAGEVAVEELCANCEKPMAFHLDFPEACWPFVPALLDPAPIQPAGDLRETVEENVREAFESLVSPSSAVDRILAALSPAISAAEAKGRREGIEEDVRRAFDVLAKHLPLLKGGQLTPIAVEIVRALSDASAPAPIDLDAIRSAEAERVRAKCEKAAMGNFAGSSSPVGCGRREAAFAIRALDFTPTSGKRAGDE